MRITHPTVQSRITEALNNYPDYLYRYQPPKIERLKEVIIDSLLHFANPKSFNDPFDSLIKFDESGTPHEWNKRIRKLIRKMEPWRSKKDLDKIVPMLILNKTYELLKNISNDEVIEKFGVLSLTTKSDNLLMWSHYADSHKGVCLQFKTKKDDKLFGIAMPVIYAKKYPLYRYVDIDVEKVAVELLTTKSKDWEYEQEWRVIAFPGWAPDGPGRHPFNPQLLTGVIFGCKASKDFKAEIIALARQRLYPLHLYQATENVHEHALKIDPIQE